MTIRNPSTAVSLTVGDATIEGVAKAATFQTDTYSLGDADEFHLAISVSAASGTTETLDITPEITYDNGTNWHSYPADINSQTAAAMAQITAAGNATPERWANIVPTAPAGATAAGVRFVFTIGGTNPSFTCDVAKLVYIQRSGN